LSEKADAGRSKGKIYSIPGMLLVGLPLHKTAACVAEWHTNDLIKSIHMIS
jgi:hypothetical protein